MLHSSFLWIESSLVKNMETIPHTISFECLNEKNKNLHPVQSVFYVMTLRKQDFRLKFFSLLLFWLKFSTLQNNKYLNKIELYFKLFEGF